MKPHLHKIAFKKIGNLQKFEFDDFSNKLRRGLMLSCSVLIVLCFIEPLRTTGSYEINIGIIKGSLMQPWIVYVMAMIVTFYYLSYFLIHLKKLVIENCESNFPESTFFFYLAEAVANNEFFDLWIDRNGTRYNPPSTTFEMEGGGATSVFSVKSRQKNLKLSEDEYTKISGAEGFVVARDKRDHCDIKYYFEPKPEDFVAYCEYKDRFLRYRLSDWVTAILPIYYGVFGIVCGVIKLLYMFGYLETV